MTNTFQTPDKIYRGTDFWMLNGQLSDEELLRQIDKMHEQGVNSFIERTYIGLRSDYPGEDFHRKTRLILERASQHGMTVFLQAGYMPNAVLDLPKEYALDYLYAKTPGAPEEGETVIKSVDGCDVILQNSGMYLDMFNEDAVRFYIKQSYADMWEEFRPYYGNTVLSIWVDEPSYNKSHLPWSRSLRERFRSLYGYDLFDKVHLLFLDGEGCGKVRYDYWTMMEERLGACYFAMIRKWCNDNNLWFSGHLMEEDTLKRQITRACAIMPYYKYFDIPGIDKLTGVMGWHADELKSVDPVYTRRYSDINTPLQCCSAARQNGQAHILAEMYGVTAEGMNFRDFKHMFDHYAAFGVNHRSVHAMFYCLHGRGKRAFPPHVNDYQPYYDHYHDVTEYVARASWFISQGEPVRDTLVLHPLESAYRLFKGTKDLEAPPMEALDVLDERFHDLLVKFLYGKLEFDLGDELSIHEGASVEGDAFVLGKMRYKTVVLPFLDTLRKKTLELLCAFSKNGGRIVVVGNAPACLDGGEDAAVAATLKALPGVTFAADAREAFALLKKEKSHRLEFNDDGSPIIVNHRASDSADYFFLANDECTRKVGGTLSFDGKRRFRLYDGKTGAIRDLPASFDGNSTCAAFTVPEGGSVMLCAEKTNDLLSSGACACGKPLTVQNLCGPWDARFVQPNVLLLEFSSFRKGEGDWSPLYPMLAIHEMLVRDNYHGDVTLRFTFRADRPLTGLKIALEDAALHTVVFNGVPAPKGPDGFYLARDFGTVSLPDVCRAGENVIEVSRNFEPLEKFKNAMTSLFETLKGGELENMYLIGDFAVQSDTEFTLNGSNRFSRDFLLTETPKRVGADITVSGFPFYCGTVELKKTVTVDGASAGKKAALSVGDFHGCVAEVRVNGKTAGDLTWFPYETDISGLLHEGENEIVLALANTLRPIIGPFHRPVGELGHVWGEYHTPNKPWVGVDSSCYDYDWYNHRETDSRLWSDSYFVIRFGVGDVKLLFSDNG